jgi:hypothetical protein
MNGFKHAQGHGRATPVCERNHAAHGIARQSPGATQAEFAEAFACP